MRRTIWLGSLFVSLPVWAQEKCPKLVEKYLHYSQSRRLRSIETNGLQALSDQIYQAAPHYHQADGYVLKPGKFLWYEMERNAPETAMPPLSPQARIDILARLDYLASHHTRADSRTVAFATRTLGGVELIEDLCSIHPKTWRYLSSKKGNQVLLNELNHLKKEDKYDRIFGSGYGALIGFPFIVFFKLGIDAVQVKAPFTNRDGWIVSLLSSFGAGASLGYTFSGKGAPTLITRAVLNTLEQAPINKIGLRKPPWAPLFKEKMGKNTIRYLAFSVPVARGNFLEVEALFIGQYYAILYLTPPTPESGLLP